MLKKFLLAFILLLSSVFALKAQYGDGNISRFRMVGTATWTPVTDSTHTGTVNFFSDLTAGGYLGTAIKDTFLIFSNSGQRYTIDSVGATTFSSAFLRIKEYSGTTASPTGQIMVYNRNGLLTIPQVPFGSTGITAQLEAAINTYNASLPGGNNETIINNTTIGDVVEYDSLVDDTVVVWVTRLGGSTALLDNPAAGVYELSVDEANNTDILRISIYGRNTNLNGSNEMIFKILNAPNARRRRVSVQLFDASNGALVDQQVTGTVHVVAYSGATTTITIPGLNGFGSAGYFVEIR